MTLQTILGAPLPRVDGRAKVTGQATFAADVPVAKLAHAVIVSSTIARGRVVAIDTARARRMLGVLAVITHDNVPRANAGPAHGQPNERTLQILQSDEVLYADQPIAVVVADSLERAQHAALSVEARYHADAAVADLVSSLGSARKPKHPPPAGETDSSRGSPTAALAAAAHALELVYTTPVQAHNPMEPHATIAVWQGSDHLTLYDSTQHVYGVRQRIADVLGLAKDNVRVVDHFVGGAFGCKGAAWSHVALAAIAAKVVGRPVKLVITRTQMFAFVGHRPKTVQTIAIGCDREGKLVGIRHDVVSETSRFDEFTEPSALQTRMLYACPNVATSHRIVPIDIGTPTFQRAPGEATGTFALECAMDELATAAQIDPLELRLRNYADADPHEGKPWSSKSLRECYRAAADKFGWSKRSAAPRSMRDGGDLVGWGMATATYPARMWPGASARARIDRDGRVVVQTATHDLGTGTYTVMTQIAAATLDVPVDRVRFELGDTALPEAPLSAGSMTVASVGPAVKLACEELARQIGRRAVEDPRSPLHGLPVESLVIDRGALVGGGKRQTFAEIVAASGEPEIVAEVKTAKKPEHDQHSCHSFGADFVEVRVDEELGRARVTRMVAAFSAGKFLNANTARSQLMGGLVWALGFALEEHVVRDPRTARVVTRDLADYHVPVNADMPAFDVIMIDEVDPYVNDVGAKGIGEIGLTGAAAAIANAIYHATGKRIRDLPITVDKLMRSA